MIALAILITAGCSGGLINEIVGTFGLIDSDDAICRLARLVLLLSKAWHR